MQNNPPQEIEDKVSIGVAIHNGENRASQRMVEKLMRYGNDDRLVEDF